MPLTEVTVTGLVTAGPNAPADGNVTFELNATMTLPGEVVAVQQPLTVELDPGGTIPAGTVLYATDDPLVQPDGVAYRMTVRGTGIKTAVFYFNLSHLVATFDISNAVPGTPPPSAVAYATQAYVDSRTGTKADDSAVVHKSLYDTNTILKADTDDTPVALEVPPASIVGRDTTGGIAALSPSQVGTLLGVSTAGQTVDSQAAWGASADQYDAVNDWFTDVAGGGRHARLGSATGADSSDPRVEVDDPTVIARYIYTPGTSGNGLALPDSPATSLTGDQFHEVIWALPSWTPASTVTLFSKFKTSGNQRSLRLDLTTNGTLQLLASNDGVNTVAPNGANPRTTASVGATVAAGPWAIVRVGLGWRASDGRVQIFAAPGLTGAYVPVGTDLSAPIGSIFDSTAATNISGYFDNTTQPVEGNFYGYTAWSDLAQTNVVAHIDPTDASLVAPYATFTESSVNQATVSIVRSPSGRVTTVIDLTGAVMGGDDYAAAPGDPVPFSAAQSFSAIHIFRFQTAAAGNEALLANKTDFAGGAGWVVYRDTANQINLLATDQLGTSKTVTSPPVAAGVLHMASVTRDASGHLLKLYVDGVQVASTADTTGDLSNSEELRIGRLSGAGTAYASQYWIASRLFSRALSLTELNTLQGELVQGVGPGAVPAIGTYASVNSVVRAIGIAGETQFRETIRADLSRYISDGASAPVRYFAISAKVGGLITSGSQSQYSGYESGVGATRGNNTGNGFRTLKGCLGQSNTANGCRALSSGVLGNENTADGNGAGQQLINGFVNTLIGIQAGNSLQQGNNNQILGAEGMSYATNVTDNLSAGYYSGTGWGDVLSVQPTAPNPSRSTCLTQYGGHVDVSRTTRNFWTAISYKARIDGDYALALGYGTQALAPGAMAVGTDSTGLSATTSTQDESKVGTILTCLRSGGTIATGLGGLAGTGRHRLGQIRTAAVALDATRYLEHEVDGTIVKLLVAA